MEKWEREKKFHSENTEKKIRALNFSISDFFLVPGKKELKSWARKLIIGNTGNT